MSTTILPTAKALYVCDRVAAVANGKIDLYGSFNAISATKYPHIQNRFSVFAKLTGGLGDVPFLIDIRNAATDDLIHTTTTKKLHFPSKTFTIDLAVHFHHCEFPEAGLYLIALFCDNQWICDTTLWLE